MAARSRPSLLSLKGALLGVPLPTRAHAEERLSNAEALTILSSDALSSVAYATQEIVLVLMLGGVSLLAKRIGVVDQEHGPTLLDQLGQAVSGNGVGCWCCSWPRTAICRASSPPWGTGWCSATASWP